MPRHHDRSRSRRRRPFRKTRRPARRAAVERLEPRRLLSTTPLGVNVVQNPGAEQGYDHWQADGTAMAVVGYGGFNVPAPANAPPNGGQNLWYGGERESFASLYQVLDFNFPESLIDSGSLSVDASAWLGSAEDNVERGVMTVWFRGPTFNDVIATSPIFGPSISERGGRTELQFRDEEIAIPPGTRHVSVSIESKWPGGYSEQTGVNADGSVDNVSVSYKLGAGSGGDSDNWVIPGDADFGDVPFTLQLPAGVAVSYDGDLSGAGLSVSGDPSGGNVVSFTGALNLPALNLDSVDASLKSTASINNTDIVVGTGSLAIGNGVPLSVSGSSSVRAAAASLITGNGGTPADVNGSLFSLQIDALASLNPGNSPGIFYAGNTQLESGSTLIVELHGPVAGFSYDQLDVAGTVALGGSSLTVDLQYDPADGQEFVIVDNDGTDAVSGTFSGLPEGSAFLVDGKRFFITYSGGDGNDVVLRRNRQPVSAFETRTVAEDVLLEAVVSAVDPDGDGMTFSVETPPAHAASFSLNSDGTFTYQADEHFSGSDSFRYVANDGDRQAVLTQEIEVTAVADEPLLSVTAASGDEGTPIPLAIAPQLVDADGSESLSVLLGGIPENTLLNRGTRDPLTGDWTVDPADLTDLTIESPDNQAFELSVAVTATEGANAAAATISDTLQVTVNNVAPTLTYTDQIAGSQQLRSWTNLVTITDPGYADPAQGTTETFTYTINWGDGTATDTGAASVDATGGPPAGGEPSTLTGASFDASHTYAEDGRYTVTVTVTDDDGGTASAVFEVRVMLRLLDVSYSSETATLNFTDPVDPATVTHSSVRLMGSQSGLLNDDTADFTVTGATVTVPLLHRAFAGETLTVILPADRDEAAKPGVWSVRANPIYEPEIDRQIAAATAGTGNFVQTSIDLSGPNPTSSYPLLADFNRDGYLDYLDEFALMTRSPDAWHWESISWNDESFLPDVYAADSDGDGVLEAVPGNLVADFDLDGEPEELTYEGIFSNFHLDGQAVNPLVWPDGRGRAWDNQLVAGDYDGDGDVDVLAAAWYWGSSHSWLWLNPTRNPSPDGVTLREFSISGFRDDAYAGGSDDGFISADLNGDGRDDLVANRSNAVMVALAPTDDWTTSEEIVWAESISFRDDGPNSPDGHTALDFDGDGDLDLAIDYYSSWERGLSGTHLYANDGHGNFSLVSVLSEIRGLTAADVNNDGAIDLVGGWSTDEDGPPVLLNSPAGTSAQVGEFEQFAASRGAFAFDELFDFEGTTGVTASHSGRTTTVWNRNSGSWTEAASFSLEKPPGVRGIDRLAATEGSVVTVDVTSNGSSDYDISLRFYDRAGDGTWSESTPHTFVGMSTSALQVDIDGDVAVLSIGPSVYTFEKTASGNWSERTDLRFDAEDLYSYTRSIQVSEDWLFVYNSHGVQVYRRTEAGWARHGGIDDYYHGLRYAVSYSDGRLAVGERDGYDTTVSIYTTADHATWFLEQRLSSSTGGASFALSGDVIAIGDHDHNSVQLYRFGADGWQADTLLECPAPRDPPPGVSSYEDFGFVDFNGSELWIAAPGDDQVRGRTGSLFRWTSDSTSIANRWPTIAPVDDVRAASNAPEITVDLAGISGGWAENQPLRLTATSSDTSLIPDPTVSYAFPATTGSLTFTPVADRDGTATITVTVEDAGLDGDLATADDNASISRSFLVEVVHSDVEGDTLATALPIAVGTEPFIHTAAIGDGFYGSRDVDLYKVDLTAGTKLTAEVFARRLSPASPIDSYLKLFDADGQVLRSDDDSGGSLDSRISEYTAPAAGSYYVGVSTHGTRDYEPTTTTGRSSGTSGHYELSLSAVEPTNLPPSGLTISAYYTSLPPTPAAGLVRQVVVADLYVNDDGFGTHLVTLSGDDAADFEILEDEFGSRKLALKAGTVLDPTAATEKTVVVTVQDPELPDDSLSEPFAITISTEPVRVVFGMTYNPDAMPTPPPAVVGRSVVSLPVSFIGGLAPDSVTLNHFVLERDGVVVPWTADSSGGYSIEPSYSEGFGTTGQLFNISHLTAPLGSYTIRFTGIETAGVSVPGTSFSWTNTGPVSFAAGADGWAMLLEPEPESGTASIEAQTVDAAGVTYVVGSFSGSLDFDPRPDSELILAADGDAGAGFIARYDAAGGVLGVWQIGAGVEAIAAANGRLALAGTFQGAGVDLDPRADVTTSFGVADEQYKFVLTIDAITGEPVSTTLLSVTAADGVDPSLWYAYGGTIDAFMLADDGRVFLGGSVRSATVSGPTAGGGLVSLGVPNNESDGYVAAIDPSGFVSWAVRLEGDPAMYVPATVGGMALAGDLLALGVARSGPLGSLPNEPEAVEGVVVIGLEAATGGYRWHTSVADGEVDNGDAVPVAATADGRVHVAGQVWLGDYETGTVNSQVATIDAATGSLVGTPVSVGDLVGGSGTFYAVALLPQADNSTILMTTESFADTMDTTFHLLDLGPSGESGVSLVADWSATQRGWPLAVSLAPDGRIVLLSSLEESDLFPIGTGGEPQRLVSATGYTTAVWSLRDPFSGEGDPGANELPTLGLISDITIAADSSETEVTFSGVSAGGSDSQALRITATSSDTGLIPDPTVVYASADATGTLAFTPVAGAYGLATITVTVADAGLDGDLDTADDNGVFSRSFEVALLPAANAPPSEPIFVSRMFVHETAAGDTPASYSIPAVNINGDPVNGLTTQLVGSSSDAGIIPDPVTLYEVEQVASSLSFTPRNGVHGRVTFTIAVEDGGTDNDLTTAGDNRTATHLAEVTVLEIIATAGSTILGKNPETNVYANTQPITLDEQPLKMDTNGFTAVGAESAAAGNAVLLQREGTNYRLVAENTWQIIGMFDSLRNASALVLKPASREPQTFSLTAITGAYEIDGLANPTLTVHRGQKVTFDLNVPGHPFHLQTTGGGYAAAAVYTQGFAGDGQTSGQFEWIVPDDAPDELFYQCEFHPVMFGKIIVVD